MDGSLPNGHYTPRTPAPLCSPANVNAQRGWGVFERSVRALQLLNEAGYGRAGSGLGLDLVYNPGGAFLAPQQQKLEAAYKQVAWDACV